MTTTIWTLLPWLVAITAVVDAARNLLAPTIEEEPIVWVEDESDLIKALERGSGADHRPGGEEPPQNSNR